MFARANKEAILVQYSKRDACSLEQHRFGTLVSIHRVAPYGASLHAHSSLGHGHGRARLRSRARSFFWKDRAQSHSSSPFGDASSRSHSSINFEIISRSSFGVADRCIPRGTLPHRSAVFRVPRILSDTRAARIRVRLTAAAAGFGSSTPWCPSAARPCSPFDDHDRSGSITLSVVEVAHGFSLLTFRCRESVLRALSLRRSSFELVLSHLAMIEPALATLTSLRSRLLHLRSPCDERRACIRARIATLACAES